MSTKRTVRQRGQTLVEFALVIPIFLVVLFGTVDGARLVYTNSQLAQAAREAARVASVEAAWTGTQGPACVAQASLITAANPGAHVCPADVAALKADVVTAANTMVAGMGAIEEVYLACDAGSASGDPAPSGAWTDATVPYPDCGPDADGNAAPNASGELVSVRVVFQFTPITPIAGPMLGSVTLSAASTMVIH